MLYEVDDEFMEIGIIPKAIKDKLSVEELDKLLSVFDNLYMPISDEEIKEHTKYDWFDINDVITTHQDDKKVKLIKVNKIYNTNTD